MEYFKGEKWHETSHHDRKVAELSEKGMKWTLLKMRDGIKLYEEYRRTDRIPDFEILSSPEAEEVELWYKDRSTLELIKKVMNHDDN